MKKIISAITATFIAATSVFSAFGATADNDSVSANTLTYQSVSTLKIKPGNITFYPYNLSPDTASLYVLNNKTKNTSTTVYFKDFYNHSYGIPVSTTDIYEPLMGARGYGGGGTRTYKDADGKYEIVRIKLSDYSNYFNADGSHTQYCKAVDGQHDYPFKPETLPNGDKIYSSLFFESGAAVTCATPNKNGEVEILVSRNPEHGVSYSTDYRYVITSNGYSVGGGGGVNRSTLRGLRMGDVDLDGYTDISDVTAIQNMLAYETKLTALQTRNADIDNDKTVTIKDVTVIQRYLAEYDISQYYQ